jgi:hypothetical protein
VTNEVTLNQSELVKDYLNSSANTTEYYPTSMGFMNEILKEAKLKKAMTSTNNWKSKVNRSMINMNNGFSTK